MMVVKIIWYVFQAIIGFNLVFPIVLLLIYMLRKPFVSGTKSNNTTTPEADYAIIVTAYEQTTLLPAVVKSLLELQYQNYLIYIVADKCDITDLHFESDKVILLRPEQVLASNTRSHFYAIRHFTRVHERLTIIDSDNLVDSGYLNALNTSFDKGFKAVQGVREAKNLNTVYACLDGARDIYYHFYDGKILFEAGSSATLAGSGMAFTTALYRECLEHLDITGAGFDKVLQHAIVSRGHRIAFCNNAMVYDEKTTQSAQLVNQRARWINTWFKYFKFGFALVGQGILKLSWNRFLFGLVLLRPPLFMFLLSSVLLMALNLFLQPIVSLLWLAGLFIFVFGFVLSLVLSPTDKRIYRSLVSIPRFMMYQVISLVKSRTANQRSVATKHTGIVEKE